MTLPRCFLLTTRGSNRLAETEAHLAAEGIQWQRFYGPDHVITGLVTTHTYEVDHPGSKYVIHPRGVGGALAQYMAWQVCFYLGRESYLILEDDAQFLPGWRTRLDSIVPPDDWDMILIGSCNCGGKQSPCVSPGLYDVRYPHCTHAYIVRNKALPVLLERMQKIWAPIDLALGFNAYPFLHVYTVLPRLVEQRGTYINP